MDLILRRLSCMVILLCSTSLFCQTSMTITVTHTPGKTLKDGVSGWDIPDWKPTSITNTNCFKFLTFRLYHRSFGPDKLKYKLSVTNNSEFEVDLTCSRYGLGGGRVTVRPKSTSFGSGSFEMDINDRSITVSNVSLDFTKAQQEQYEVGGVSRYLACGETPSSYVAEVQKKQKQKNNQNGEIKNASSNSSYSNEEDHKDENDTNENKSFNSEEEPKKASSSITDDNETGLEKSSSPSSSTNTESPEEQRARLADEERQKQAGIEKQKQAEAADLAKRKQEFLESENERKRKIEQQNQQILASTTAAQAGLMYLFGTLIYGNYGYIPGGTYEGGGFNFGIDGGYGITASPIFYNSTVESPQFGGGTIVSNELQYSYVATLDLNTRIHLNYEKRFEDMFEVGGGTYLSGTGGFLPTGDTQVAGNFGLRFFGGLDLVKFYADYEIGARQFVDPRWLSVDEFGLGKTVYGKRTWKLGARFSFLGNDDLSRHHITMGLLRQRLIPSEDISFDDDEKDVFVQYRFFDDERQSDEDVIQSGKKLWYKGFFMEWKHEHHGRFFLNFFPNYPFSGVTTFAGAPEEGQEDGSLFFQVGFSRVLEDFF